MSANALRIDGLDDLRQALRNLPAELTSEASFIVNAAAQEAARRIVDRYPNHTGNLKDHVKVSGVSAGQFGAAAVVKNTAKHAYMFENGTQARHTSIGANRGSMPPGHVFIPEMIRKRREMYEKLKAMMERAGLVVTGEP